MPDVFPYISPARRGRTTLHHTISFTLPPRPPRKPPGRLMQALAVALELLAFVLVAAAVLFIMGSAAYGQTTQPANPGADAVRAVQALGEYAAQKAAGEAEAQRAAVELAGQVGALTKQLAEANTSAANLRDELARLRPMRIGINVAEITDYNTAAPFANAIRTFRGGGGDEGVWWSPAGQPFATASPPIPVNADGYPLADASSFGARGYPAGRYRFAMSGSGTASVGGKAKAVAPFARDAAGVLRGEVDVSDADTWVTVTVRRVDPADPPRDMRLMAPGTTEADTFSPWFLARAKPVAACVRFMLWGKTNSSPLATWAQRRRPSEYSYVGPRGVAYEDMIGLANVLRCDAWVNVPHLADDDYRRQMARMFRDGLAADLNCYAENSNEAGWNNGQGFAQGNWFRERAAANPELTYSATSDLYGRTAQQVAVDAAANATIWRAEWAGPAAGRLRCVLNAQSSSPRFVRIGLETLAARGVKASDLFYALTPASYVGLDGSRDVAGLTADGLFAALMGEAAATTTVNAHRDLAASYGLAVVNYEAGQSLVGMNAGRWVNIDLKNAAQTDPRMGDVYRAMLARQQAAGSRLLLLFNDTESGGKFGWWGHWPRHDAPDGPKNQAVSEFIAKTRPGS